MMENKKSYNLTHNPYGKLKEDKPNHHGIALNNAGVISNFSAVLEERNKEIERLRKLFLRSASIVFDIREQMRGHDSSEECPFCMGELFDYERGQMVKIEESFLEEAEKERKMNKLEAGG